MIIRDRIYGQLSITNPLIADIIASGPMQRLKAISQDGAPHFIQPVRNVNRFEHSVGAWYLSSRYSRPIEEQLASLLHDVPHTAFSHVIDFVMHDERHEYHDRFTKALIMRSEIPEICARHGIDIQLVLHKEHFHLLENDLPDISVDRWDYFMRDGYAFGLLPKQTVKLFLSAVKVEDNQFYFDDLRIASQFAILFTNFCRLIWLDPTAHGSFFLIAEALKIALVQGIITQDDLFQTDEFVLTKLQKAHHAEIDDLLARLQPGRNFAYAPQGEAEFYGPSKPRNVDPLVKQGARLCRVSELVPGFRDYIDEFQSRYRSIGVVQR